MHSQINTKRKKQNILRDPKVEERLKKKKGSLGSERGIKGYGSEFGQKTIHASVKSSKNKLKTLKSQEKVHMFNTVFK